MTLPSHPHRLRAAIDAGILCDGDPPWDYDDVRELSDDEFLRLQDWCASHVRLPWMTGIAAIEAAAKIAGESAQNNDDGGPR